MFRFKITVIHNLKVRTASFMRKLSKLHFRMRNCTHDGDILIKSIPINGEYPPIRIFMQIIGSVPILIQRLHRCPHHYQVLNKDIIINDNCFPRSVMWYYPMILLSYITKSVKYLDVNRLF